MWQYYNHEHSKVLADSLENYVYLDFGYALA